VEATFELEYEVKGGEPIEPRDVEHFAFANGTFQAWPYWREYAQSATSRMGVPPLVIGVYKIPSVYDPD
jgi:preprotein translocase subunit SecB